MSGAECVVSYLGLTTGGWMPGRPTRQIFEVEPLAHNVMAKLEVSMLRSRFRSRRSALTEGLSLQADPSSHLELQGASGLVHAVCFHRSARQMMSARIPNVWPVSVVMRELVGLTFRACAGFVEFVLNPLRTGCSIIHVAAPSTLHRAV